MPTEVNLPISSMAVNLAVNDGNSDLTLSPIEPGPSISGIDLSEEEVSHVAEESEVKMKPLSKQKRTVLFYISWISEMPQGIHTEAHETEKMESQTDEASDELDYFAGDEFDSPMYDDYCYSNWKKGCCFCRSTAQNRQPKRKPHRRVNVKMSQKLHAKENVFTNICTQKDNIESKLRERGLQRMGLGMYFRRVGSAAARSGKRDSNSTASCGYQKKKCVGRAEAPITRKPRKRHQEDHPAALKHELRSDNIPDGVGVFMRNVVDLQHRDLTPEDYELLLMLDESVAPKTVSKGALESLQVVTVDIAAMVGELCTICMELYQAAQNVKTLPCKHTFHADCIDHWLLTASQNCPLDGLAIIQA